MMNKMFRRAFLGSAMVAVGTVGLSTPAFASTSSGANLAALEARAAAAVSVRESALSVAVTDVGGNQYLTSADRTAVLAVLTSDEPDLNALGATITADTTYPQAVADYRTIFTTYRVFALRLPQARFAESADDLTGTVLPHLSDAQSRLQVLLSGPDATKDTGGVQALMSDLATQIDTLSADTSGLSAAVLALTPAQYNADPAVLGAPRSQLVAARAAARQANSDISRVMANLR
jgi:hypothetical protein